MGKKTDYFILFMVTTEEVGAADYHKTEPIYRCVRSFSSRLAADNWVREQREKLVDPQPDIGPAVNNPDDIEVYCVPLDQYIKEMRKRGDELEGRSVNAYT